MCISTSASLHNTLIILLLDYNETLENDLVIADKQSVVIDFVKQSKPTETHPEIDDVCFTCTLDFKLARRKPLPLHTPVAAKHCAVGSGDGNIAVVAVNPLIGIRY